MGIAGNKTGAAAAIQAAGDGPITPDWCAHLARQLEAATWQGASACQRALPPTQLARIFREASKLLKAEPTLLQVCGLMRLG